MLIDIINSFIQAIKSWSSDFSQSNKNNASEVNTFDIDNFNDFNNLGSEKIPITVYLSCNIFKL